MQPLVQQTEGDRTIVRFRANKIVNWLIAELDKHTEKGERRHHVLNEIAMIARDEGFSREDQVQLAQLIGYSLTGFHELSYVSDEDAKRATEKARKDLGGESIGGCRDFGCPIHTGMGDDLDDENDT